MKHFGRKSKKVFVVLLICFTAFPFTACNQDTFKKDASNQASKIQVQKDNTVSGDKQGTSNRGSYYNEELNRYEIIDGYSECFLEIMGEKITFNGDGYQDISSPLHERIMFNAVRFYMAAASEDNGTLKKMANKELLSEIETSFSKTGASSFKFGGNVVTSFKDLSIYKKPISITAPKKINESEYTVTMEYSNKNKRHFVDAILIIRSNEVKIKSFLIIQ